LNIASSLEYIEARSLKYMDDESREYIDETPLWLPPMLRSLNMSSSKSSISLSGVDWVDMGLSDEIDGVDDEDVVL
jgi:hypothetical protein